MIHVYGKYYLEASENIWTVKEFTGRTKGDERIYKNSSGCFCDSVKRGIEVIYRLLQRDLAMGEDVELIEYIERLVQLRDDFERQVNMIVPGIKVTEVE